VDLFAILCKFISFFTLCLYREHILFVLYEWWKSRGRIKGGRRRRREVRGIGGRGRGSEDAGLDCSYGNTSTGISNGGGGAFKSTRTPLRAREHVLKCIWRKSMVALALCVSIRFSNRLIDLTLVGTSHIIPRISSLFRPAVETRDADELPNEDEATLYRGIHATATTATWTSLRTITRGGHTWTIHDTLTGKWSHTTISLCLR
jgi:hypothetical protein